MKSVPGWDTSLPAIHLVQEGMLDAAAYLRAAQAYMLISMPTGTSTIFGAFQAILALPRMKPDVLRPADKVIQIKKFASGFFFDIAAHNSFEDP